MNRTKLKYFTKNGLELALRLPVKMEVCSRCEGRGTHVNPAVDGNGITAEEWANDYDDDTREAYMSGRYDIQCEECQGANVVPAVDESKLTPLRKLMFKAYLKQQREISDSERADRETRFWENGGMAS